MNINTKSIREQVTDILRMRIINGELKPGDRISERDISRELNISTTPIKEAIRGLETAGLLITLPRKGTMVSEFAKQNLSQQSTLRSALEGVAANLAARNMDKDACERLKTSLDEVEKLLDRDDIKELESCNKDFHEAITNYSNNPYLIQLIETQRSFNQGFRHGGLRDKSGRKQSLDEHRAILEAIERQDSELAETLMRNHIRRSAVYVLENIEA